MSEFDYCHFVLLTSYYYHRTDEAAKSNSQPPSHSRYKKKVEFLLSWTHKYGLCLSSALPELEVEICTYFIVFSFTKL